VAAEAGAGGARAAGAWTPAGLAAAAERAAERIAGRVRRTPLEAAPWLTEVAGAAVYLKLECWQPTRSFKVRGAWNAVLALGAEAVRRGVITASAGNHGQAVALAAAGVGAAATVYVPAGAAAAKTRRIRRLGAALVEVEGSYDDAEAAALAGASETGGIFVHPCADAGVAAGQGTVALEVLEALPDAETLVVPVGGGGLLAGAGAVMKGAAGAGRPRRVVGVQSDRTQGMWAAFAAGRVVPVPVEATLADGLAGQVAAVNHEACAAVTDELLLVDETAIAGAIRALWEEAGVVAEGSGAVGVAAVLAGRVRGAGPIVVVVTGGNIDGARLAPILGAEADEKRWR
jgi:threonine dehydratase